jgi:tetratricopeptide (TPR) repeat protein
VLANTAFCLAIIERDLPKARALLDEAAEAARIHRLSVIDVELATGYLAHLEGSLGHARMALERGLNLARTRTDAWRQSMALIRLAMIDLETSSWVAARSRVADLRAVATRLGEGSEAAIADALDAIARRSEGDADAPPMVAAGIEGLVRADAKAMLAYVLTWAADMALADGAFAEAGQLAGRALEASAPLGKPSASALAHTALGRAALGAGRRDEALSHLAAAEALLDHPYGVSKRTREAVEHLTALSNEDTNADTHEGRARRRRRR